MAIILTYSSNRKSTKFTSLIYLEVYLLDFLFIYLLIWKFTFLFSYILPFLFFSFFFFPFFPYNLSLSRSLSLHICTYLLPRLPASLILAQSQSHLISWIEREVRIRFSGLACPLLAHCACVTTRLSICNDTGTDTVEDEEEPEFDTLRLWLSGCCWAVPVKSKTEQKSTVEKF